MDIQVGCGEFGDSGARRLLQIRCQTEMPAYQVPDFQPFGTWGGSHTFRAAALPVRNGNAPEPWRSTVAKRLRRIAILGLNGVDLPCWNQAPTTRIKGSWRMSPELTTGLFYTFSAIAQTLWLRTSARRDEGATGSNGQNCARGASHLACTFRVADPNSVCCNPVDLGASPHSWPRTANSRSWVSDNRGLSARVCMAAR
jgi:hypothetical protein